ncbi:MAG: hypothetical protein ACM362_03525 [Candidatus Methylomirabilota bacterium]
MGRRKGKGKSGQVQKVQPRSGWPKLLVPGILVVAVAIGAGTWFLLQKSSPQVVAAQYTGGARLWVDSDYIDFGTVRFEKFVDARFRLRNVGDQPLRLPSNPPVDVVEGC